MMRLVPERALRRTVLAGAVLAGAVLGGTLVGGCTSGRSELGTGNSGCYVALPSAVTAVHDTGRLKGVRLVSVGALRSSATLLYRAARQAEGPKVERVCLVAFSGHFSSEGVEDPLGRAEGSLAVVELSYPDNRLLATLIVARPPLSFGHSHIGLF